MSDTEISVEPSTPCITPPIRAFPSNGQLRLARKIRIYQTGYSQSLLFRGKLDTFELIWPIDGQVQCMHGLVATPKRPVLLIPGIKYIFQGRAKLTRAIVIQFQVDRYPRAWHVPSMWPNFCDLPDADICRPLLCFLLTHASTHDPILIRPALTMLIVAIVTNNPGYNMPAAPAFPPVLIRAIAAIRNRLNNQPFERIKPKELATEIGCCRGVLDKYFKRFLHHTPAQESCSPAWIARSSCWPEWTFPSMSSPPSTGFVPARCSSPIAENISDAHPPSCVTA